MAVVNGDGHDADLLLSVRSVRENTHSLDECGVVKFDVVFNFYNYEKSYVLVLLEIQTSSGNSFMMNYENHILWSAFSSFRLDGLIPVR